MTRWLQDNPNELVRKLRESVQSDLRELEQRDVARALMSTAADMLEREIIDKERMPLHWRLRDCWNDAFDCLRGSAYILRRRTDNTKSWQWPSK